MGRRHADVDDRDVRLARRGERDELVAVGRLADDLKAGLGRQPRSPSRNSIESSARIPRMGSPLAARSRVPLG